MFTGIVESVGMVAAAADEAGLRRFTLDCPGVAAGMAVGDSIAVNGVCLTAVAVADGSVSVEAVPETLQRTNLGAVDAGDGVNLERPLAAGGRFDGHIVQGHVDGVGTVRSMESDGADFRVWVDVPGDLRKYLVEKGSVAMDGVSLTVSGVDDQGFEVVLIPHTLDVTVLDERGKGTVVNLEVDVLAKYVERLLEERS